MAGYSSTSLVKKLGILPVTSLFLYNSPDNYALLLETDISRQVVTDMAAADLMHIFAISRNELEAEFAKAIKQPKPGLVIWISWYKKSSGIQTDITEDIIRQIVIPAGWVDLKVCAVTAEWSGLKIVKRKIK